MKFLAVILAGWSSLTVAAAQCTSTWQHQFSTSPGASHQVFVSHLWDRDGAGPLPAVLVIGGRFAHVNGVPAACIALQDLGTGVWSAVGGGVSGGISAFASVRALATLPNGDLVAAGNFTTAGGVAASLIARWDGATWSPLGSGISGIASSLLAVRALAVLPNGDLVAGGNFRVAGGVPVTNVARWDGAVWSPFGLGLGTDPSVVNALAVTLSGELIAGGSFVQSGTAPAGHVARWDGSTWSSVGGGLTPQILALALLPNGDLVAGGGGNGLVPTQYLLHRWNGVAWATIGSFDSSIESLGVQPNGDLIAGGRFTRELSGPTNSPCLARWNGVAWSGLGTGLGGPQFQTFPGTVLGLPSGDVVVGGAFATAGGNSAPNLARWDGVAWHAAGVATFDAPVLVARRVANGDVIVGGGFTAAAGGVPARGVARWDGAAWSALGTGPTPTGVPGVVRAVTEGSNGDLFAGGDFTLAAGAVADRVARWDGTAWAPLGAGVNGIVRALATMPNGDVVAAGDFTSPGSHIARWDGVAWSPLGTGTDLPVYSLAVAPNGDLFAGGQFLIAGGVVANKIARWDGAAWSPLANVFSTIAVVECMQFSTNGDLIVAGSLGLPGPPASPGIARWDGSAWHTLGTGFNAPARAITTLPDGDLLVGGSFTTAGGAPALRIARWNGATWSAAGAMDGDVLALATDASGLPLAGGNFQTAAAGVASAYITRWNTTCPALTVPYGTGCTGPGGALSLAADDQPWAGATFHVTVSGLGTQSVGLMMFSFGQIAAGAFPIHPGLLGTVPGPGVGCDLLVASLDHTEGLVPQGGDATWVLPLAPVSLDPTLPGLTFHLQVAELDFPGTWVGTYTTNGLTCTVGAL